ncbi:hypothetical protein T4D_16181 [Trichinella pseudospiralis]|uniref:Uncharacterized protein n=1 Tax=Trichinella pseudospiralis TaxID=6337 RepID=A0A0V1FWN0_TRIPS|nr:hypothetical protein T4D_16181 [Trichinella pseudospiralis]
MDIFRSKQLKTASGEAIEEAVGLLLYIRYNRLSRSLFVRNRLSSINCRFFSPKASIQLCVFYSHELLKSILHSSIHD